jgi:hypothetical protein
MPDEIKGHPAWEEILKVIPAEYHPAVKPTLLKWDQGVTEKLTEVRSEYEPYKKFIEAKIDPTFIENSLSLASSFQNDPASVVAQAIEAFELDYLTQEEAEALKSQEPNNDLGNDDGALDLENDPRFKAMKDTLDRLEGTLTSQQQSEQEKAEQERFEKTLKDLEEEHGSFDRLFVTALVAQGIDAEQAVKSYQNTINQAVESKLAADGITVGSGSSTNSTPPVVMGGNGESSSGLPENPVDFAAMTDSDVKHLALQFIEQDAKS